MKTYLGVCLCSCVVWVLASCSATPGPSDSASIKVIEPVSCVAVLPAQAGTDEELARVGGQEKNVRKGADYADSLLVQELAGNPKVRMVSSSEIEGSIIGNLGTTIDQVSKATNCDAVLVTSVLRFRQRQGTTYAADEPASASFEMRIYNAGTKHVLWATDFSETQQTLMSNLFSFSKAQSRGFKWITVEELFSQGMKERLAECPYL